MYGLLCFYRWCWLTLYWTIMQKDKHPDLPFNWRWYTLYRCIWHRYFGLVWLSQPLPLPPLNHVRPWRSVPQAFPLAWVILNMSRSVPGVGHSTKCNWMGEIMMDKTGFEPGTPEFLVRFSTNQAIYKRRYSNPSDRHTGYIFCLINPHSSTLFGIFLSHDLHVYTNQTLV